MVYRKHMINLTNSKKLSRRKSQVMILKSHLKGGISWAVVAHAFNALGRQRQ